jgi:hypothetical protein
MAKRLVGFNKIEQSGTSGVSVACGRDCLAIACAIIYCAAAKVRQNCWVLCGSVSAAISKRNFIAFVCSLLKVSLIHGAETPQL